MRIFFVVVLWFCSFGTHSQSDIPELRDNPIHDVADVLSSSAEMKLRSIIQAERDSTSNEIGILTIRSLEGNSLEDYSMRVAEKWKLGNEDKDNGVLLLISIDDRLIRIETGYGLEGSLTDAMA